MKAEHMQFKHMLHGLSDEWIDAGTRRSVHYSHLPAGQYVFRVMAANSDGVWSDVDVALAAGYAVRMRRLTARTATPPATSASGGWPPRSAAP